MINGSKGFKNVIGGYYILSAWNNSLLDLVVGKNVAIVKLTQEIYRKQIKHDLRIKVNEDWQTRDDSLVSGVCDTIHYVVIHWDRA